MTDLEKFIELYKSIGIELGVNINSENNNQEILLSEGTYSFSDGKKGTISEKLKGYMGFYSSIEFDLNGKFIEQGFWE